MARLPNVGSDNGQWGQILNDYLSVEHNTDGTLKKAADIAAKYEKPSMGIPAGDLSMGVQTSLTKADTSVQSVNAVFPLSGNVTLTATDVSAIPVTQKGAANGVASLDGSSKLTASQLPANLATKSTSSADTGKAIDAYTGLPLALPSASTVEAKLARGVFGSLPVVSTRSSRQSQGSLIANISGNARTAHKLTVSVPEIKLVYANWCGAETSGSGDMTFTASIEYPLGTILGQVTFRGSKTAVLSPDGIIVSDPFEVDVSANEFIYVRTHWDTPTSWPQVRTAFPADNEGGENSSSALTDKTLSGTISATQAAVFCPSAIIGAPVSGATAKWVAILGDSIANGQGDYGTSVLTSGYIARALDPASIPYVSVARGGETSASFNSTSRRRRQLTASPDYVYDEYGTNDVYSAATLATVQANALLRWTRYANRGAKVFTQTISPRATSTDAFTTISGQTSSSGNTVRVNYNNWVRDGSPIDATTKVAVAVGTSSNVLRAGAAGHPLGINSGLAPLGYVEIADVMESSRDSGKWKIPSPAVSGTGDTTSGSATITNVTAIFVNGQAISGSGIPAAATVVSGGGTSTIVISQNATATATGVALTAALTVDGTHPAPAMHALMAAALPTALFA